MYGEFKIGDDIGFIHEGLHLLLQEEWAQDQNIINRIKVSGYQVKYYHSWATKYEQALVIGLECCMRNLSDMTANKTYLGCNIGDVFDKAYPLIKEYYVNGCERKVEKLMLDIITCTV